MSGRTFWAEALKYGFDWSRTEGYAARRPLPTRRSKHLDGGGFFDYGATPNGISRGRAPARGAFARSVSV